MIQNAKDFKLGAGLAGFCLLTLFYLIPSQIGPLSDADALMPVLITVFLLVLSLVLMLQALHRPTAKTAHEHPPAGQTPRRSSKITLAAVVAIMCAYAWLLDVTGFVLTSLVAMVMLFLVFGVRRWLTITVITLVTLAALYVCFDLLLGAPLPVGTLIEHFLD